MAELRSVDPRTLQINPNNPRRTPVPPAMDEQLVASIKAVGIIQPPCVTQKDDELTIVVGNRRVKAAIAAELPMIDVMVCDADEAADAMRSVAENLIRASMSSVDIWRAIERLEAQGWNEQAIGDAGRAPGPRLHDQRDLSRNRANQWLERSTGQPHSGLGGSQAHRQPGGNDCASKLPGD